MITSYNKTIHPDLINQLKTECIGISDFVLNELSTLNKGKYNTFWLDKDREPTTFIEYLVKNIGLRDHSNRFPNNFAGFEWWIQNKKIKEDIVFHYDKDEALCSEKNLYVYPLNATITYLTDIGGPTAIFKDTDNTNGILSFPEVNKHIIFQGNLFHGVIGSLAKSVPTQNETRLTLLINYWHQKPLEPNCIYFPHEIYSLLPISDNLKQKQELIQYESSQIIKMNYRESQNIIIYRMSTPIQIIFDKKLEKKTYSFSFNRNNSSNSITENQLINNQKYNKTLQIYDRILKKNKTFINLKNKGDLLIKMREYEKAWDIFIETKQISTTKKEYNEIIDIMIGLEKYISPDNLKKYYIDNLKYYNNINNQQQYKENLEKLYKLK